MSLLASSIRSENIHFKRNPYKIGALILFFVAAIYGLQNGYTLYQTQTEEIEKIKRSFYAGCVGYFASNSDMETCITLRSALIKDQKIYLQAGAGVVFDSDPKSEYQECLNKSQALVRAYLNIKNF